MHSSRKLRDTVEDKKTNAGKNVTKYDMTNPNKKLTRNLLSRNSTFAGPEINSQTLEASGNHLS